jgi:Fur family ferric uptake transcriptional regulator
MLDPMKAKPAPKPRCSPHDHESPAARLEQALALLERSALKRTQPRVTLIELLAREHGPFSIDEIQRALKKRKLDQVTVYRCLSAFEEIGLARRCEFGDGVSRYELQVCAEHPHYHVICVHCRAMRTLEDDAVRALESKARELGFSNVRHSLAFYGVCRTCA